jgi:chemotaxis protein methyltransferase CheR
MSEHEFRLIREVINSYCGFWVPDNQRRLLSAKLAHMLEVSQVAGFHDYYHLIKYGDGMELERAVEAIVNNETYFFRETAQLEAVTELVRDTGTAKRSLRILSAGCSSGEEPYTIAMLLEEEGLLDGDARVEVHGVDISTRMLDKARVAKYTSNSFRGTEGRYLNRYFKPTDGVMRLDEQLRRRVSFSRLNLHDTARMTTLGMFDVILCRNVIIYFDPVSKLRSVDGLIGLVREGGHLFLGHSESLFSISNALEMVQVGNAIGYRKPITAAKAG